ncbi:MAG: tripartite tricarboxylate transporter permease [Alphaproteobacteria bacterium]|nr:tripartite tricarboxylate transporter permease [Alphaproteobacteria bacterium]
MSDLYNPAAIFEGLAGIMSTDALTLMLVGIVASSIFAAIPGIGSLLLLSMVIPYAMELSPYSCIAFLLGIGVVSNTANTFSSVLIAVPGSAGSQATILDGHPMAKKGEARRAFGAAYTASAIGGIFGAVIFVITLPVMKPLVFAFGSPEFLMLVLWGLSAVGILSGNSAIKGLMAAVLGLGITLIGTDARTGIERYTFEDFYLWDGIKLVLVALGVFAVPELVDLSVRRTSISDSGELGSGTWQGVKDVFKNWWLVVRCSAIGVWVGFLPGLGSSVADWFAYAHCVQTEKNKENFGKGDVRGVIAPEASNNAKEGGALIPTTIFGIPGSTSYALMLAAFIAVGITPGEQMLGPQLPYLYGMLWVLVIANLIATGLSMGFSNAFAKLSLVPFYIIVPMTLIMCVVAAFSANFDYADLLVLVIFSVIGVFMKRHGWPRPPLLVAVVLGSQMQNYLWLTVERYYFSEWLARPGVIIIGLVIVATIASPIIRAYRQPGGMLHFDVKSDAPQPQPHGDLVMAGLYIALALAAMIGALDWPPRAALPVYTFTAAGIALALVQVGMVIATMRRTKGPLPREAGASQRRRRYAIITLWFGGLLGTVMVLGFQAAFFAFPLAYARTYGASWRLALGLGIAGVAILIGLFDTIIHIVWPEPLLQRLIPIGEGIWY